ncbi:DsrE family protein [Psychroflexus sediminis]|uniref:DsrE/DsrF-like family protein n=1 Tax=Psychroflexus sediminis TaxID=470826 RepID=A0A1G7WSM1_9FLAO|nr:DsrE family protein [Psychroflexus sediminis]SDG74941.1 DsrE/DsrF-like family protein [Psychroflexus sediminis]
MKKILLIFALFIFVSGFSQTKATLASYGPVYKIGNTDFKIDLNQEFKAVFDVASGSEFKDKPNQKFVTVARYLRLHQAPELKNNSVKAALVVHGSAIFDLLNHEAYALHHNEKNLRNPNYELLSILSEYDVDLILCGQTSRHRSIDRSKLHPDIKIALSAMTTLIHFQKKGYTILNF